MRVLTGACLLLCLASTAGATTWTSYPAFEYSHYGFVSEVGDATALMINPAGLAGGPGTNMYLDVTGNDDEVTEYVAALQGKSLCFAYRHRDLPGSGVSPASSDPVLGEGNLDSYILGTGYGRGAVRLGLGTTWTKTDLPGDDAFSWQAGVMIRMGQWATLAGRLDNIQHPNFLNGELRPRYTYGFTTRPILNLVTVSVQGSHEDGRADIIDMLYGVRIRPDPALNIQATVEDAPGSSPTLGASVSYFFGKGAVSGRLRTLDGVDGYRGQVALQAFDEFWQQGGVPNIPAVPRSK
jgi:hypothetical protein